MASEVLTIEQIERTYSEDGMRTGIAEHRRIGFRHPWEMREGVGSDWHGAAEGALREAIGVWLDLDAHEAKGER